MSSTRPTGAIGAGRRSSDLFSDLTFTANGPRGFVVAAQVTETRAKVLTSPDGVRWHQVRRRGTTDHPVGLFPGAPIRRSWFTVGPGTPPTSTRRGLFSSRDGVQWTRLPATPPDRLGLPFVAAHDRRTIFAIQYEPQNSSGGRLWSTHDGSTWTETKSFHRTFPTANPDHLVQSGHWWVLGGNRDSGQQRKADMWVSPDLRHWQEMPARLRGKPSQGTSMQLAAHRGTVVGVSSIERKLWIWNSR